MFLSTAREREIGKAEEGERAEVKRERQQNRDRGNLGPVLGELNGKLDNS